ncbi:MAG TPA: hypothetical protein VKA27_06610 [Sunxiuqinia sp.]|nr:hypothetical protein [Sunxiuqinia sp.]
MNQLKIRYLKHEEVDTDRWDQCIEDSPNSLVYAQSWYLDKICDRWDALVLGDYQYVMPLTNKKKVGISYLSQPLFCQQLGIFPTPTKAVSKQIMEEVTKRFQFVEINLNAMQLPVDDGGEYVERQNYLLWLSDSYEVIAGNYSKHTRRKLKKAAKANLSLVKSISVEEFFRFKKKHLNVKQSDADLQRLRNVTAFSVTRSMGQVYGVYSSSNQLCAAVFFIRHKNRVTYLNAVTSPEGKEHQAMFFLIDQFIKEHTDKNYLLDFEGSMVSGVARLYKGFGATPEKYYRYRWNNLPWWIKWLKR